MPKLVNREIILFKLNSGAYGVDAAPAASDAVLVENVQWDNRGRRMIERPAIRSSLGALKQVYGGSLIGMRFDVEIKGSGAAGTAPEFGALLRACRMGETVVALTSVTYKPVSGTSEEGSLYYYEDGKLWKMLGARGNVTANLRTGGVGKLSFDLVGHLSGPTDAALVTPTYDSTVPPALVGVPFTVDSYAAVIEALSWDLGNVIAMPPSIGATDGYGEITITARDVNGTFDPEAVLVATKDFMGQFKSGAVMNLTTGVIGATAGNRYQVTMPAISYRDISPGNREGIRTYNNAFGAAEATTDDEVSIVLT